jgi:hypothetical protein
VFPPSRTLQTPSPRATEPGGLPQAGPGSAPGANTPGARKSRVDQAPASGRSTTQPGAADKRTGKNAANVEYEDCMRLWEPGTHMSKQEWSTTCRRVQSRLNQVHGK